MKKYTMTLLMRKIRGSENAIANAKTIASHYAKVAKEKALTPAGISSILGGLAVIGGAALSFFMLKNKKHEKKNEKISRSEASLAAKTYPATIKDRLVGVVTLLSTLSTVAGVASRLTKHKK